MQTRRIYRPYNETPPSKGPDMFKNISPENKLVAKVVAGRILLPIAITVVVSVIVKKLED